MAAAETGALPPACPPASRVAGQPLLRKSLGSLCGGNRYKQDVCSSPIPGCSLQTLLWVLRPPPCLDRGQEKEEEVWVLPPALIRVEEPLSGCQHWGRGPRGSRISSSQDRKSFLGTGCVKLLFCGVAVAPQRALCWVPGLAGGRGVAGAGKVQCRQQPCAALRGEMQH